MIPQATSRRCVCRSADHPASPGAIRSGRPGGGDSSCSDRRRPRTRWQAPGSISDTRPSRNAGDASTIEPRFWRFWQSCGRSHEGLGLGRSPSVELLAQAAQAASRKRRATKGNQAAAAARPPSRVDHRGGLSRADRRRKADASDACSCGGREVAWPQRLEGLRGLVSVERRSWEGAAV